jgi:hypothetical protein
MQQIRKPSRDKRVDIRKISANGDERSETMTGSDPVNR